MPKLSESTSRRFISSFVPRSVALADPSVATSQDVVSDVFYAAVLFVDISDFTSMTERFERSGPEGVEHLTEALDRHFGMMIAKITDAGGEIENMLGDALLAYWPSTDRDVRQTVHDALVCAVDLQTAMAGQVLDDATHLNVHAALVAGSVEALHLGGHAEHRLYLLRGEPLDRISGLVELAGAGELVVDATVRELMGDDMRHDAAGTGGWRFDGFSERMASSTRMPVIGSSSFTLAINSSRQSLSRPVAASMAW